MSETSSYKYEHPAHFYEKFINNLLRAVRRNPRNFYSIYQLTLFESAAGSHYEKLDVSLLTEYTKEV